MSRPTNMREPPQKAIDMNVGDREPIPDLPSLARRRELRERFNVTQQELADDIGVSRQTIMSWEKGTANPTGDNLATYARILSQWEARLKRST